MKENNNEELTNEQGQTTARAYRAGASARTARQPALGQKKRIAAQSLSCPPVGAKPAFEGAPLGMCQSIVPVSFVAKDMGVSARRVRMMLQEGRLHGQQQENGYWQVFFPYQYVFGTRGPVLKRQQKGLQEIASRPKKLRGEEREFYKEFLEDCKD